MAKTLVIKGANYAANALDNVIFESVPCTGITFSESAYSLTGYDPVEIEYAVTPADTTDPVVWASSDNSVVTVSDGVIQAVGIGSATITATCGAFSASAVVTVALSYTPNWVFSAISDTLPAYYTYASNDTRLSAFGASNQAGEYVCAAQAAGTDNLPVIVLPRNTEYVRVSIATTSVIYNSDSMFLYWTKDEPSGATGGLENTAKKIANETPYNGRTYPTKTFAVPNGADSMLFTARFSSAPAEGTNPNTYAQTIGLTIEFLAEAE